MNYTLGNAGGPGKPKKMKRTGPKPTGKKEGEASREDRMKRFNNPVDKKRVSRAVEINTESPKLINKKEVSLNEYGLPIGDQKYKKSKRSMFGRAKDPGQRKK